MNSEKVKEIKKALACCNGGCNEACPYYHNSGCINDLLLDTITLINELESENERLLDQRNKTYNIWVKDTKKLKAQIAELEKENAKLLDSVETVQSNRCVYKCVLTKEHLKQFAERLKENNKIKVIFNEGWIFSYVEICKAIDETLKECLGK